MEEVSYTLAGTHFHEVVESAVVTHKGLTLLFTLSLPINNPQILEFCSKEILM